MARSSMCGSRTVRVGGATRLLLVLGVAGLSPRADAVPVTYTLTIKRAPGPSGVSPSGTLGAVPFGGPHGDVVLVFHMVGDTSQVTSFSKPSAPIDGVEVMVGIATVEVRRASTGTLLAHGTFLNSSGIFVSADHTNGGVGFGSQGVPFGDAGFPGQPVYPFGLGNLTPAAAVTLKKSTTVTGAFVASCLGFPVANVASCGSPTPLFTTAGDLVLDASLGAGAQVGTFKVLRR